jgi:hypothetical protein
MEGEQELWFFVSIVLACLLVVITILYFLKKGKTEKEIVYKEKKVVVHEPAEGQRADDRAGPDHGDAGRPRP